MIRLRYFTEFLRYSHTWPVMHPHGWQGVVAGRCQPDAVGTRGAARRWVLREAWHMAGVDVQIDRKLRR